MIVKLNLFFVVMDLLTLLSYPVGYVHGKLCQFSKSKESITLANYLVGGLVTIGR